MRCPKRAEPGIPTLLETMAAAKKEGETEKERQLSGIFSHEDTNPVGSGPHPYDSFILNYFLRDPISKYNQSGH